MIIFGVYLFVILYFDDFTRAVLYLISCYCYSMNAFFGDCRSRPVELQNSQCVNVP